MEIICVDFQKDFTTEGGSEYRIRSSVTFVKKVLTPFLVEKKVEVSEIVSDYRQPRPGDKGDCCRPGEIGFESDLSPEVQRSGSPWVKCMNSPIWTREGIGDPAVAPGLPYQDPEAFSSWLHESVGPPREVLLFGLTLDCCILCTSQELCFRGYKVKIIEEATDTWSGNQWLKGMLFTSLSPVMNWASSISWERVLEKFQKS